MRRHLWWLLGLALVGAGVALVLVNRQSPLESGWYAYTPLDVNEWSMAWGDDGPAVIWSVWQLVGVAVAALGLVVVASGLGYRLGRRRGRAD